MLDPQNLIGKPLVVYIDGERRPIGTIVRAVIRDGSLYFGAILEIEREDLPRDS